MIAVANKKKKETTIIGGGGTITSQYGSIKKGESYR